MVHNLYNYNPNAIEKITIEKLFGYYSYKLAKEKLQDLSKLIILYGDNGSGKTTILKLIFCLLSTAGDKGHKSYLAKYEFKRISVLLAGGIEVGAIRKEKLKGDFNYYIKKGNKTITEVTLKVDKNNSVKVPTGTKEDKILTNIYEQIKSLNLSIVYITDDRKTIDITTSLTTSDNFPYDIEYLNKHEQDITSDEFDFINRPELSDNFRIKNQETSKILMRLHEWIRKHAISGSISGEQTTNAIYVDIIKRVTKSRELHKNKQEIITLLELLSKRSIEYSQFELATPFDYKAVVKSIKVADKDKLNIIIKILEPFTQGLEARFNALANIQTTVAKFLGTINTYFIDKAVSYTLSKGFEIKHKITNEPINFNLLSSGEKQLLVLTSNTIINSEEATIFIIDEPELSLNVKWQRMLIKTLLDFSKNGKLQFIMATHSLELLTNYAGNVIKLKQGATEKYGPSRKKEIRRNNSAI